MNGHGAIVGDVADSTCRLCLEGEESSFHVIAECPALARQRHEVFGTIRLGTPLAWSDQMSVFLSGRTIGRLLGTEDSEMIDFEVDMTET